MNHDARWLNRGLTAVLGLPLAVLGLILSSSSALAQSIPTNDKIVGHLVISELLTGSRTESGDQFVELYNPTVAPVSLAGWSLQYKDTDIADSTMKLVDFSQNATVPARGYFLIGSGSYAGMADASLSGDLESRGGSIFLANSAALVSGGSDSSVVDLLGYGSPVLWSEGAPAESAGNGHSIERLPGNDFTDGNGVDTNNNQADFSFRDTPQPQNSSSALENPGAPLFGDITPAVDGYIASHTVNFSVKVTDIGSSINPSSLELSLDGVSTQFDYDAQTGMLTAVATAGEGTHTAHLMAADYAGFVTDRSWNFTIDTVKPTVNLWLPAKTNTVAITALLTADDQIHGFASGVSEMRLAFDGIFDTETWQPYNPIVMQDLMNQNGEQLVHAQVRDRAGNVSDMATGKILVDLGSFAGPINPTSSTVLVNGLNQITINWQAVPGAAYYIVRYSDGESVIVPERVDQTMVTINSLDPTKHFAFEVAAVTADGLVSQFSRVFPDLATALTAQKSGAPESLKAAAKKLTSSSANTATPVTQATATSPSPSPTPVVNPSPDALTDNSPSPEASPGDIKASEDTRKIDWTRFIVALSILIIAAGVATGAWYLYQWWSTTPRGNDKPKGGRW